MGFLYGFPDGQGEAGAGYLARASAHWEDGPGLPDRVTVARTSGRREQDWFLSTVYGLSPFSRKRLLDCSGELMKPALYGHGTRWPVLGTTWRTSCALGVPVLGFPGVPARPVLTLA